MDFGVQDYYDSDSVDTYQQEPDFVDYQDSASKDNDSHNDNDNDQPAKKKPRGLGKTWVKERDFENRTLALEFINNENCWTAHRTNKTFDGTKVYYRCNKVQKKGDACPASIHLLYYADREAVGLFRTQCEHDHDGRTSKRGLDETTRSTVLELYNNGIRTPKAILAALRTYGHPEPPYRVLATFLHAYRKENSGPSLIPLVEFVRWCVQRSDVPADPDKAFVICHTTGHHPDGKLICRTFLSTTRLLGFALRSNALHADSTYKVNCYGFPAFVIGTSDLDRQFFPLGIGICAGETGDDFAFMFQALSRGVQAVYGERFKPSILISDASDAFPNAFRTVFGSDFKRLVCWDHVVRAIDKKLDTFKDKQQRQHLRDDIYHLKHCLSQEVFHAALPLFFDKWTRCQGNTEIWEFLRYFESEWIQRYPNWYDAYAMYTPSTNSGLELITGTIKFNETLPEPFLMAQFLNLIEMKLESSIVDWSKECDPNGTSAKKFATIPTKTTSLFTEAYQWALKSKAMLSKKSGDTTVYYIQRRNLEFSTAVVGIYRRSFTRLQWDSFDYYVHTRNMIWVVTMPDLQWENATCSCPTFLKEFICKHSLGVAIRKNYCQPPKNVITESIAEKRKRNRQ